MRILGNSSFFDLMGQPGPKGDPGPAASWSVIPDKPETFPPEAHGHDIDSIVNLRETLLEIATNGNIPADLETRLSSVEAAQIMSAAVQSGIVALIRADGTTIALPVSGEPPAPIPETGWIVSTSPGTMTIHGMPEVAEIVALVEPKTIIIEGYNG